METLVHNPSCFYFQIHLCQLGCAKTWTQRFGSWIRSTHRCHWAPWISAGLLLPPGRKRKTLQNDTKWYKITRSPESPIHFYLHMLLPNDQNLPKPSKTNMPAIAVHRAAQGHFQHPNVFPDRSRRSPAKKKEDSLSTKRCPFPMTLQNDVLNPGPVLNQHPRKAWKSMTSRGGRPCCGGYPCRPPKMHQISNEVVRDWSLLGSWYFCLFWWFLEIFSGKKSGASLECSCPNDAV